jgi:hypothetical protein
MGTGGPFPGDKTRPGRHADHSPDLVPRLKMSRSYASSHPSASMACIRTEPFVPEPSAAEVEVAIRKMKKYEAPGSDQIPTELIQAGGETLHSEVHKIIMLILNIEELHHLWKESIVIPIHKKGDKTDCSNYRGISLLSTSYKILSNILLSRLIPYADEIIGDHQCGCRRNRSTTDQIFYIRQTLEKK